MKYKNKTPMRETVGRLTNNWNQLLAFSPLYAVSSPAPDVFWPGCAVMRLGADIVGQTYQVLAQALPGLGFSGWCCAKPTFAAGSQGQRLKRERQLSAHFTGAGIKRLFTLCPNCQTGLARRADVKTISAWPILAKYAQNNAKPAKNLAGRYILHDPCAARGDKAVQEAARAILTARGVSFAEFVRNGANTRCCGRKDMLFLTDPAASQKLLRARLDEAGELPVVSYCESCVEAFRGAGCRSAHLLEIIFDAPAGRSVWNRVKNAHRKDFYA